jgi:hypothetical protein
MAQPATPSPVWIATLAVAARCLAKVARPVHRERVYRGQRTRRRDVAALLETQGR